MDDRRIELPDYQRTPAIFGPKVREPQETLQIRNPRLGLDTGYTHSFKMLTGSGGGIAVSFGTLNLASIAADASAVPFMAFQEANILVNSNALSGDPAGGTVGELAVSPSTTYGVWLRLTRISADAAVDTTGISGSPDFVNWILYGFGPTVDVIADSTYIAKGNAAGIVAANTGYSFIYIGKAETDGSSNLTFTQHLRSDLVIPAVTLPFEIISADADNVILNGTDDGLFYDPP